jgi:hypothetical protein
MMHLRSSGCSNEQTKKKVGTELKISEQLKNKAFHYKTFTLICCNYSSYFGARGGAVG